jgi:hypothetical protein
MRIFVILLLLLLLSGCATTKGPDSGAFQPPAVIEQPSELPRPAAPVTPDVKHEEPESTPAEKASSAVPASITPQAEPLTQPVEKPEPRQQKDHRDLTASLSKPAVPHTVGPSGLTRLAEANDEKLIRVFIGMDKPTVELIMASAHNPAKRERITGSTGQAYEVLFYLTREPRKGKPVTERLMTPVILRNNEVVAIGNFNLKKLRTTGSVERKKRKTSQP